MKSNERLLTFARQMRHVPAPTEEAVWKLLRNRRLAGFKFRRQHLIGPYIADFFCPAALLVLELDGVTHAGQETRDQRRDDYLRGLGIVVLRVWNTQVSEDEEAVVETVFRLCSDRVAALPTHPRHAGARHWKRSGKQTPSPGPRSGPTSPPGER